MRTIDTSKLTLGMKIKQHTGFRTVDTVTRKENRYVVTFSDSVKKLSIFDSTVTILS